MIISRIFTHYVEMSLLDAFYENYIDFENYIRDILDARYTNVAGQNEPVSDEKESYSRTVELATLNENINEHLKGETESYQKVIRLLATKTPNNIDKNVWKTVSNKSQRIRNTNLVNEIDRLEIPPNNAYKPLYVDFYRESSNEHDDTSTSKEAEMQRNSNFYKNNNIERNIENRKRPEHCITERYIENQCKTGRSKTFSGNRSYTSTTDYRKKDICKWRESHKKINRKRFNNLFEKAISFINPFAPWNPLCEP